MTKIRMCVGVTHFAPQETKQTRNEKGEMNKVLRGELGGYVVVVDCGLTSHSAINSAI